LLNVGVSRKQISKGAEWWPGQLQVMVGRDRLPDFSSQGLKAIWDLVPLAAPQMGAEDVRNE
jgi:hypothetical protein